MVGMNITEAIQHARADVAEVGKGFVYNPFGNGHCFYISQQDPRFPYREVESVGMIPALGSKTHACQVGRILMRAGLMTDALASCTLSAAPVAKDLGLDNDVAHFLGDIQEAQDHGASAGDAFTAGLRALRHTGR
jgi:hypothetical protein